MPADRLVQMANQIGSHFVSQRTGNPEKSISDHLKKFWDPRMRRVIIDHAAAGGAGLDPVVLQAVRQLKA